ncbi:hypothetical protein [Streptomyces sp. Da 82-17]|uniref:hypothetical protein n=1 Tax=Streptomyces sp. Da 82-17 TaxID=3377116 RepID=UPI0038D48026
MQYRITAPVHGHSGIVAGITFADGVATCCDPPLGAIEYFRRHRYEIVVLDAPDTLPAVEDSAASKSTGSRGRSGRQRATDTDGR